MHAPSSHGSRASVALLALTLAVTGCGGRNGNANDNRGATSAPAATAAADATRPTTATATATPGTVATQVAAGGPTNGCAAAALDRCEYGATGVQLTTKVVNVTDASTGRKLAVEVFIPQGAGPFPVILYAHGGGFDDQGYAIGEKWARAVAPHGFIVGAIANVTPTLEQGLAICAAASVPKAECAPSDDESTGLIGLFKMRDVLGVVEALPALIAGSGIPADASRIGVMGWSGGSRGVLATRGIAFRPSPSAPVYSRAETRIAAVAAFSPAGVDWAGYFDNGTTSSWTSLLAPTFVATGDNDVKPNSPTLTGPIRRQAFDKQPAGGMRLLLYSRLALGVGGHGTFNLGDLGSSDQRLDRYSRALASAVRAFFDANLGHEAAAGRAWLASSNAAILAGDVDWLAK